MDEEVKGEINAILHMVEKGLSKKYLGVALIATRLKSSDRLTLRSLKTEFLRRGRTGMLSCSYMLVGFH